jgi:hypothetical protein
MVHRPEMARRADAPIDFRIARGRVIGGVNKSDGVRH